jgi:hypothetical protein
VQGRAWRGRLGRRLRSRGDPHPGGGRARARERRADNQPAALQAWNRFTASLDRACAGLDAESPYRALLDRLCHGRDEIVQRMTPQAAAA